MGDAARIRGIAALELELGSAIVSTEPLEWGFAHQTHAVRTARGGEFVVTWLPVGAGRRIAVELAIRRLLVGSVVPLPEIVATQEGGPSPFLVTRRVTGQPGPTALDEPAAAAALGRAMGTLVRALRSVSAAAARSAGLGEDAVEDEGTQSDTSLLGRLSSTGRRALAAQIDADREAPSSRDALDSTGLGSCPRPPDPLPVLSHGDFVPANVLINRGSVTALLDWEHAGIRDPLADVAWWRGIVLIFHPETWRVAWPAFVEAAGVDELAVGSRLVVLAARQIAERAAAEPEIAGAWLERLERLLELSP